MLMPFLDAADPEATPPDDMAVMSLLADAPPPIDPTDFDANLAEAMEPAERDAIAEDLLELVEADARAREDWDRLAKKGQRLMGVNIEAPARDTPVTRTQRRPAWTLPTAHPLLAEAIVRFQAQAGAELFPPEGPAKGFVLPDVKTIALEEQASRVARLINWIATDECPEYGDQTDRLLFLVALEGVVYTKDTYDPRRFISRQLVRSHDVWVPWHATTFDEASRVTHRMRWHPDRIRRLQADGYLLPIDLSDTFTTGEERTEAERAADQTVGLTAAADTTTRGDTPLEILEVYTDYRLTGPGLSGEDEPYVFTIARADRQLLAVRRNWRPSDPRHRPWRLLTQWPFVLGDHPGPYAYGLPHLIGSLSETATTLLQSALLIAGKQADPPGFVQSAILNNPDFNHDPLDPGEIRAAPTTIEDLQRGLFFMPPGNANALATVLQFVVEAGQRFASTADLQVGAGDPRAPVGTTLAMIEQGSRVYSSIHARLHRAQRRELRVIADLIGEYTPPDQPYPYPVGSEVMPIRPDFDGRVDVVPVSDPRIISMTHRLTAAQAVYQLAVEQPQLYDLYQVNQRVLQALRVSDPDKLLKRTDQVPRRDVVSENMCLLFNQPVRACYDQDHDAHVAVHQQWFQSLPPEGQTQLTGPFMAHMGEHLAFRYRVQMEAAVAQMTGAPPGSILPPPPEPGEPDRDAPEPDPQALALADAAAAQAAQAMAQSGAGQPGQSAGDPDQMRAQAALQDADTRAKAADAEAQIETERLQTEAATAAGKLQLEGTIAERKLKLDEMRLNIERERLKLERERMQLDAQMEREQLQTDAALKAAGMVADAAVAEHQRDADRETHEKQLFASRLSERDHLAAKRESEDRHLKAQRETEQARLKATRAKPK